MYLFYADFSFKKHFVFLKTRVNIGYSISFTVFFKMVAIISPLEYVEINSNHYGTHAVLGCDRLQFCRAESAIQMYKWYLI